MSSELCRLCAQSPDTSSTTMLSIFDPHEKERLEKIETLTGMTLKRRRQLPQQVCADCTHQLEQAYNFRERCIETQAYFGSSAYRKTIKNNLAHRKSPPPQDIALKEEPNEPELDTETELVLLKCESDFAALPAHSPDSDSYSLEGEKFLPLLESPMKSERASPTEEFEFVENSTPKSTVKTTRKRHMQSEFICDQCGNHFRNYNHFQTHLKRHTGEKSHQCEICPDKFFTHSELTRHMRRHTGERPFACQHCERRFTDYSTRIKHERTHTNERPFACPHCDKAFTTSYILKNHILVHTGERSFKCHSCNKSFQRQTHLIVHYRSLMHKQNEEKQQQQPQLNSSNTRLRPPADE